MTIQNKIIDRIRSAKNCVLSTHTQPDGDALGSLLALGSAIGTLGVPCTILGPGPVPKDLEFLPLQSQMTRTVPAEIDVMIVLDCAEKHRIAPEPALLEKASTSICIDHHRSNRGFCDLNWIDPDRGATVEMVYELYALFGLEPTKEQATCLYTGLVTDTGRFLYSGTTAESLKMAAHLMDSGIDRDSIHRVLFQSMPFADFLLYRQTIHRAEFYREGRLGLSWITLDDFSRTGASPDLTDPALNALRDIREVEVSCLLKEQEPRVFKVSLRSKQSVNVAHIAQAFGGGGHLRAAGGTIHGPLEEVKEQLLRTIDSHWDAPA